MHAGDRLSLHGSSRRRAAFTLIDLIVVVACLGLLLAILLPTFIAAQVEEQKQQSLSNLRQLGAALHDYAKEHDDRLPWSIENGKPAWSDPPWPTWAAKLRDRGDGNGYIADWRVFWGPGRDLTFAEKHFNSNHNFRRPGYAANIHGAMPREGNEAGLKPLQLSEHEAPDELILLVEAFDPSQYPEIDGDYGIEPQLDESRTSDRGHHLITYDSGAPRLYMDGHASAGDSQEIGWKADGPREGQWTLWPRKALRGAPWFDRR